MVDVLASPIRKCNIYGATTFIVRDSILTSLFLVHAGYLFCNWHSLNTNYYGTTLGEMPGTFNSSQINACGVGIYPVLHALSGKRTWLTTFSLAVLRLVFRIRHTIEVLVKPPQWYRFVKLNMCLILSLPLTPISLL